MSLLNPLLLALGAAALVVPLWVHLRLGKVRKRATVGSLRLMRASPQTSRKPRRLVNRPLLLLRCLITLLVALGFARLLLPWLGQPDTVESAAIVLDVSGSMQAKNGKSTSWELAREAALAHIDRLAPSARVALVYSPSPAPKVDWMDPSTARAALKNLKPGFEANQLHAEILTAVAALNAMPSDQPKILHVISDFQRSSFTGIDQASIPQDIQLQLSKTSPEKPVNRGVTVSVTQAGAANQRLYSFNDATPGNLTLSENPPAPNSSIVAGHPLITPLPAPRADGYIARKLQLMESDDIAADNTAADLFRPQQEFPVWLWEPNQTGTTPKSATEKPTYFLSRALQPSANANESVSPFRPRAVSEDDLAAGNPPALLIIPAHPSYPESLASLANAITAKGGSVIFFGGKSLTAESLAPFGKLPPALPGSIEGVLTKPALEPINYDHLLFGSLGAEARRRLAASPLFQRHSLTLQPSSRVLASFADRQPFVVEGTAGTGRTYFVNTSADREFGDLPADAPRFIPLVHLLVARAVESNFQRTDDTPFIAGEARTIQLPQALAGKSVVVEGNKHAVSADGKVPNLVFREPGEKAILAEGAPVTHVVVNFPPAESGLDNLPETVVRQRLESQRRHEGGASVRWENHSAGELAWQLSLLCGSLLLLVEPLFADRKQTR